MATLSKPSHRRHFSQKKKTEEKTLQLVPFLLSSSFPLSQAEHGNDDQDDDDDDNGDISGSLIHRKINQCGGGVLKTGKPTVRSAKGKRTVKIYFFFYFSASTFRH